MASLLEEIADTLARDVIEAAQTLGDDNIVDEVSKTIGASSTTTQEAFLTAVRVRLAEGRARKLLEERLARAAAQPEPAEAEAPADQEEPGDGAEASLQDPASGEG